MRVPEALLWHPLIGYTSGNTCRTHPGVTSTAAIKLPTPFQEPLTVYVGGANSYLYALNASTGAIVWRQLVVRIGTTEASGYIWGSPLISNGAIYIGVSSQCDNPLIRGGIKSFDMHTGAPLHVYWTTPPVVRSVQVCGRAPPQTRTLCG